MYAEKLFKHRDLLMISFTYKISFNKLMGVYCLDLVTPGTCLHNAMDKTDIVTPLTRGNTRDIFMNVNIELKKKPTTINLYFLFS
jgi:hypothetical protein